MLKIHIGLNNDLLKYQRALWQELQAMGYNDAELIERYEQELASHKEALYLDYFVKTSNEWLNILLKADSYKQKTTNPLMYSFLPHLELFCSKSTLVTDRLIEESIKKLKQTLRKDLYKNKKSL